MSAPNNNIIKRSVFAVVPVTEFDSDNHNVWQQIVGLSGDSQYKFYKGNRDNEVYFVYRVAGEWRASWHNNSPDAKCSHSDHFTDAVRVTKSIEHCEKHLLRADYQTPANKV